MPQEWLAGPVCLYCSTRGIVVGRHAHPARDGSLGLSGVERKSGECVYLCHCLLRYLERCWQPWKCVFPCAVSTTRSGPAALAFETDSLVMCWQVVLSIGRFARDSFGAPTHRIPYEQMPDTRDLLELCEVHTRGSFVAETHRRCPCSPSRVVCELYSEASHCTVVFVRCTFAERQNRSERGLHWPLRRREEAVHAAVEPVSVARHARSGDQGKNRLRATTCSSAC